MSASTEKEFRFNFDPRYRAAARLFGVTDRRAVVRVLDRDFTARFGPWTAYTPLANISAVSVTGSYRFLKTAGPAHLSLSDRGQTFATNGDRGVCLEFARAFSGLEPFGVIHHPNRTVTVADTDGLMELLMREMNRRSQRDDDQ
jgi:hypothetical protein